METLHGDRGAHLGIDDWNKEDSYDMPKFLSDLCLKDGKNGVILSGLISWIIVQRNEFAREVWRSVAIKCWSVEEISCAKKALKDAGGQELIAACNNININRKNNNAGRAGRELDDISEAIEWLTEHKKIPLVLSTAAQQQSCSLSLGSVDPNANIGELVTKSVQ